MSASVPDRTLKANCPMDLLVRDHHWRGNQQMIAGDTIYGTLHGIDQQPTSHGSLGYAAGKIQSGREWLFARFVGDEFHAQQHPNPSDIAYSSRTSRRAFSRCFRRSEAGVFRPV